MSDERLQSDPAPRHDDEAARLETMARALIGLYGSDAAALARREAAAATPAVARTWAAILARIVKILAGS